MNPFITMGIAVALTAAIGAMLGWSLLPTLIGAAIGSGLYLLFIGAFRR